MKQRPLYRYCIVAIIGVGLSSNPASALVVYDPSNFSQNVLTAARTLEQVNNQIRSLQNETVMLQNMAKNLQNLDYSSLGHMTGALTRIGGLMTQANSLSYNLEQLEAQWAQEYPDSYATSISTNDAAIAAQQRWQKAMGAYRQTMQMQSQIVENVQNDQPLLVDLVNQSQNSTGALQAQQASNQLLALSTKQQMQVQTLMATQYRAEAEDAARKAQTEETARTMTQNFLGTTTAYTGE